MKSASGLPWWLRGILEPWQRRAETPAQSESRHDMTEPPKPWDVFAWLAAYPKLADASDKTIWWAVFKNYWLLPLAVVFVTETFFHVSFHFLFKWLGW